MKRYRGTRTAEAVRLELTRQRRSQRELAEAIGLPRQAVTRRLAGQTPISVDELQAMAAFLGVAPADLLVEHPSAA